MSARKRPSSESDGSQRAKQKPRRSLKSTFELPSTHTAAPGILPHAPPRLCAKAGSSAAPAGLPFSTAQTSISPTNAALYIPVSQQSGAGAQGAMYSNHGPVAYNTLGTPSAPPPLQQRQVTPVAAININVVMQRQNTPGLAHNSSAQPSPGTLSSLRAGDLRANAALQKAPPPNRPREQAGSPACSPTGAPKQGSSVPNNQHVREPMTQEELLEIVKDLPRVGPLTGVCSPRCLLLALAYSVCGLWRSLSPLKWVRTGNYWEGGRGEGGRGGEEEPGSLLFYC